MWLADLNKTFVRNTRISFLSPFSLSSLSLSLSVRMASQKGDLANFPWEKRTLFGTDSCTEEHAHKSAKNAVAAKFRISVAKLQTSAFHGPRRDAEKTRTIRMV